MTIDEAIKVQTEMLNIVYNSQSPKRSKALRLGIEALKRVQLYRKGMYIGLGDKMPGETKPAHAPGLPHPV